MCKTCENFQGDSRKRRHLFKCGGLVFSVVSGDANKRGIVFYLKALFFFVE